MKKRIPILTIVAIALFCTTAATTGFAQPSRVLREAERITGDTFRVATRTTQGANIYAVNRPSRTVLNAIDKGLTDLFAIARKNGYRKRLRYPDYSIYIGKPDRTKDLDGNYSPDIAVGAAQYAGTIFDKGGYIYVAGMVIANDPCSFVVAEPKQDFERLTNVVRYEGEHLVLYHNDRRRYLATADHSKGGTHPILQ